MATQKELRKALKESNEEIYTEWRNKALKCLIEHNGRLDYETLRRMTGINDRYFVLILKKNNDLFRLVSSKPKNKKQKKEDIDVLITNMGKAVFKVEVRNT